MVRSHVFKMSMVFLVSVIVLSGCGGVQLGMQSKKFNPSTLEQLDNRIIKAQQQFAFDLFQRMKEERKAETDNVFISPLSIATALAMTYNGASGETKEAMAEALYLNGMNAEIVNEGLFILAKALQRGERDIDLMIANSLWANQEVSFKQSFLDLNRQYYGAEVTSLDFTDTKSVDTINKWVKRQTKGKIEKIIDGKIHPDAILFLINAIYFQGNWKTPFNPEFTQDGSFALADGTKKTYPMMSRNGKFSYLEQEEFQALRLPYGEGDFAMYVFLPAENILLSEWLDTLNNEKWHGWLSMFNEKTGYVQIPRMQLEYENSLNDVLKAMGMELAFDPEQADFSEMSSVPPSSFIHDVKHSAVLEVNEEGTKAAAVTKVEMMPTSAPIDVFRFVVDRPFYMVIHDEMTNTVLFMGAIYEP